MKKQKGDYFDTALDYGVAYDKRTYKTYQSIDWLIGELNINTQNTWRKFLNILNDKYPGYILKINTTYRSYQRSIELKVINSSNASPGRSPHNYAFAVDMNVEEPTGKTYMKNNRKPWVESGIPKIATDLGMRWGGDFQGYVDCVHFDVTRVTDATIVNATKDNKGEISKKTNEDLVNVFVPTTPNPTSGFLLMLPKKDLIYLDMSFEEASRFIVSAGTSQ